jgi:hypothetical protein
MTEPLTRPTLAGHIYPGIKPKLPALKPVNDQPLSAEDVAIVAEILDAMIQKTDEAPAAIKGAGEQAFQKALGDYFKKHPEADKKAVTEKFVAAWNSLFGDGDNLLKKAETELMIKACKTKVRPTLAGDVYPLLQKYLKETGKAGNQELNTEDVEIMASILAAMIQKAGNAPVLIKGAGEQAFQKALSSYIKKHPEADKKAVAEKFLAAWNSMFGDGDNLLKKVEAELMTLACPSLDLTGGKKPAVTLSGVTPYEVKPGDEAEFTITGENLDQVTSLDRPTAFKDLSIPEISADGKQMKFQKVRVPLGAQPGISEFVLYGGEDGDEKLTSFTVNILEGDSRTAFEKAGDYAANTLKAKGEAAFGLSTYPSFSQKVPYNLMALGDQEMPNLKLNLRLGSIDEPVTIIGRGNAIVRGNRVELLGNAQAGAQDTVHSGPDDYRLNAGLGLGLRGNFWAERRLAFSLYADSGIVDNAHRAPNKFFYNGSDKYLNLRATLDSDFRTDWLLAGIFGERQFSSFNWDGNSFPGGFSGQTEKWQLGLLGNADLTQRSVLAPKVGLKASWLVSGRTAVPDSLAGFTYEKLSGVEAEARVDFKKMPKLPFYLFGGLSHLSQDGDNWGSVSRYFFGAGIKPQSVGKLEARGDFADNPALYYGGSARFGTLAWTLPERWLQASGLTVKLQGFQIGQQAGVNGVVSLDLVPTIFGPIKTAPADK